jgi:hypothetical protein
MNPQHGVSGQLQQGGRSPQEADDEYLTEQAVEEEFDRKLEQIEREMELRRNSLGRWVVAALFMTLLLGGSIWRDRHRNQQVTSSAPAGQLLDLRPVQEPKGFWPVVLVVQTSTDFISLLEPLNIATGGALVREVRQSGRQYLCDEQRTQCAEIAKPSQP